VKIIKFPNRNKYFWIFTILFLITRVGDLIATYIGTPDLTKEANPLVYTFGLGWEALIIANIIGFIIAVFLLYYTFIKYKSNVIPCDGLKQYISMLYFNRPDKFLWTFYKFPNKKNWSFLLAWIGFVLTIVMIITSFIIITEWIIGIISNFEYKVPYKISIPYLARFDLVLISLILIIIFGYYWINKEYKLNKIMLEENKKIEVL